MVKYSGVILRALGIVAVANLILATPALAIPVSTYDDGTLNELFERVARSFEGAPGLISAITYVAGIVMCYTAIIKVKEHIDSPNNTPLRDPFIRFVIGGAMFALPTVVAAAYNTIARVSDAENYATEAMLASPGTVTSLTGINCSDMSTAGGVLGAIGGALSGGLGGALSSVMGNSGTIGDAICGAAMGFDALPGLLSVILYISGFVILAWGLLQIKDHVISPNSVPVSMGARKVLVAGIFFAFPKFLSFVRGTFESGERLSVVDDPFGGVMSTVSAVTSGSAGCNGGSSGTIGSIISVGSAVWGAITGSGSGSSSVTSTVGGLDCMMTRLVSNIWEPTQLAVTMFCYVAGIICVALAVRRFMDSMDKGPRGPLGMGTFSLLALGGCLMSADVLIGSISNTLFPSLLGAATGGDRLLLLYGSLTYAPGISASGQTSINTIFTSVFAFSFLLGMISIIRGMFILKDVADSGNGSLMAGFTHLLGGALAVNLGAFIAAVQNTLGLTSIGLQVDSSPIPVSAIGSAVGGLLGGLGGALSSGAGSLLGGLFGG